MEASVPNLRVLDESTTSRELDLVSELFHRINRIIPTCQELLTVAPTCRVRDAVALMRKHGYSQVPVVQGSEVLGVFSFTSFAKDAAQVTLEELTRQRCAPGDLPVDEFLEQLQFARVTEEMSRVFEWVDRDNGVLVGVPDRLVGILTPMDFLRYLYQVASPFVMVSEIELALRAVIRHALKGEQLTPAAKRSLLSVYQTEDKIPKAVEEMTFDNYHALISHGGNWAHFETVLGGTRTRVSAKLKEVGEIRNDLFHFRREITVADHQTLADHRNWLLSKVRQMQTRCAEGETR
jgi:predicted transcriptional regulator